MIALTMATISAIVLVGDRDRELAAAALRRHFASGRLSIAELSERIELTLRARSRNDLESAMRELPLVWEDLPAILHTTARRLHRGVRRVRFFLVLSLLLLLLQLLLLQGILLSFSTRTCMLFK